MLETRHGMEQILVNEALLATERRSCSVIREQLECVIYEGLLPASEYARTLIMCCGLNRPSSFL